MKRSEPNRQLNKWVARFVPLLIFGIVGYVSWVLTKLICVDYLIRPRATLLTESRPGPAIAILTIFYVLLIFMLLCYGRLIDIVARKPGLVPRGPQFYVDEQRKKTRNDTGNEKNAKPQTPESDLSAARENNSGSSESSVGFDEFWKRDVFACNYDGRPNFCSTCCNWKPDRAHHCSELDRCVLRMDHFCPWVGGVVGETSFKFFIQFTFWAALECLHLLVSTAYFFAERRRLFNAIDVNWAVTMALAGLFFLFAGGMCASSLQFAFQNTTTIENLSRKRKVWCLAIYIPEHRMQQVYNANGSDLRLITYPRPENEQLQFVARQDPNLPGLNMQSGSGVRTQEAVSTGAIPSGPLRTFGIFETRVGLNPWDLGPVGNFQDLMGYTIWEWFLPFRPSPLTKHESLDSFYKLSSSIENIKRKLGITEVPNASEAVSKPRKHRHRRHRRSGSSGTTY